MSVDSNDSTSSSMMSTITKAPIAGTVANKRGSKTEREIFEENLAVGGSNYVDDPNVAEAINRNNDLEGDENADEIELRVDDMKTPKGEVTNEGKEALKRLFKVNSKEDKHKKKTGKGKTKSNSELSTTDPATSSTEADENKTKKSSSNRSINHNNSNSKAGYNIFNFLFHNPTEKRNE